MIHSIIELSKFVFYLSLRDLGYKLFKIMSKPSQGIATSEGSLRIELSFF